MSLINATELKMAFGNIVALDDADITVEQGERIGLVGRNGSGKSTLMKILVGDVLPDSGDVIRQRGVVAGCLPQEFALDEGKTVLENITAGATDVMAMITEFEAGNCSEHRLHELEKAIQSRDGWNLDVRASTLMQELNAPDPDRIVDNLSGGERRRVALCRALAGNPDFLLLDEPTNHLDTHTIEWLEGYISRYRGTLMLVTHDRHFLDKVCTRIVELAVGKLYSYTGNYTTYLERKADRLEDEAAQEKKRQSFIRRELDWVRRGPKARGTKAKGRLDRFYAAADQDGPVQEGDMSLLLPPPSQMSNIILNLKDAGMQYDGNWLFRDLSFELERGQKIGIVGGNGAGKTTLLNCVLDRCDLSEGSIVIGERTEFNYVDQTRETLNDEKTVFEEIGGGNDFVIWGNQKISAWSYLKRFLFEDDRIQVKVGQLSGGERNRLLMAKVLKRGGNFLILDEPSNDLDLTTLRVLEEALAEFRGCVIVVSHDRYMLNRVCTHILAFEGNGQVVFHDGDYDYYLEKRGKALAAAQKEATATTKAKEAPAPNPTKTRRLSYMEKKEFETIEERILDAEETVSEMEAMFSAPDFYETHGDRITELTAELEAAKATVQELYARWEELEDIQAG
jgi:ATP-binding cassette subfamily F protein uup